MRAGLSASAIAAGGSLATAAGGRLGLSIGVEGDGAFWNAVVTRIRVVAVDEASLAQAAGIVAGDDVVLIEGQPVAGRRADELKAFMRFHAGDTRTLLPKRANGEHVEVGLTKPQD